MVLAEVVGSKLLGKNITHDSAWCWLMLYITKCQKEVEREREQLVCVCLSFGCPMIRMIRLAVSRLSHQECENGRTRSCAACEEGMVPVLYGSVLAYLIGQFLVLASLRKLSFFFPMLRVFEHHSNLQCYHVLPLMAATLEHGDRILNQWALRWHPLGLQMYPYNPL